MGLPAQCAALLLAEHAREPFTGPVLAYGKQSMNVGLDGALWMFETLGLRADPAGLTERPPPEAMIDFGRLVKLMGLGDLRTLDVSDYEGADIIADLNAPVAPDLCDRFGLVLDGGTMEHVFDLRQGMKNTADLLRAGGRAVHLSPVNNYVNHGFVQLSPTFYHDYYRANGFEDVRGHLLVQSRSDIYGQRFNVFAYDHDSMGGVNSIFCAGDTQLAVYFTAKKTAASTSGCVPMQSYFERQTGGREVGGAPFLLAYDPAGSKATELPPAREAHAPVHTVVHIGYGDGRPVPELVVTPLPRPGSPASGVVS